MREVLFYKNTVDTYRKRQNYLSFTIVAMSFYRRSAAENDG